MINGTITTPSIGNKRSFSKEMNKLKTNQQLLTILVLLFICLIFWIIVSLFNSQNSSKITPEVAQMAKPFNPTLSTEVLDTLDAKRVFSDEELSNFPIYVLVEDRNAREKRVVEINDLSSVRATPTPTPRPIATPTPVTAPETTTTPTVVPDQANQ